jgi:hypothetical protein
VSSERIAIIFIQNSQRYNRAWLVYTTIAKIAGRLTLLPRIATKVAISVTKWKKSLKMKNESWPGRGLNCVPLSILILFGFLNRNRVLSIKNTIYNFVRDILAMLQKES